MTDIQTKTLIYQSKANSNEKILFCKITSLTLDLLQVSLAEKTGEGKNERLVILGMLINIHELSSLASIFKMMGLLSTVSSKLSSKLESAIVKEHRRASLYCTIVLSKHMIGYWFFVKGCRLDTILSSQRPRLPSITSLSRFVPSLVFAARETSSKSTLTPNDSKYSCKGFSW